MRNLKFIAAVAVVAVTAAGCGGSDSSDDAGAVTTDAPESTDAPQPTEAPETSTTPETTDAPETTAAPETTEAPAPAGVDLSDLSVTAADSERTSPRNAGIRFFPNGSSSGATIQLKSSLLPTSE